MNEGDNLAKSKEWGEEELELFKYMYEHGTSHKELELAFNITKSTIYHIAYKYKIKSPKRHKEKNGLYFCPICKVYKAKELFNKSNNNKYGIQSKCKKCESKYKKDWLKNKKQKIQNNIYCIPEKTKEEINGEPTKICTFCHKEKSVSEFHWHTRYEILRTRCKECTLRQNKEAKIKYTMEKGYDY